MGISESVAKLPEGLSKKIKKKSQTKSTSSLPSMDYNTNRLSSTNNIFKYERFLGNDELNELHKKFTSVNSNGILTRDEFVVFYRLIHKHGITEQLGNLARLIFRAYDHDKDGLIAFNDFIYVYVLSTRGDTKCKLAFAFEMYDADSNGYLDRNEIEQGVHVMIDYLGLKVKEKEKIAQTCYEILNVWNNNIINKRIFVEVLQGNYTLRCLMSPFN